MSGSKPSRRATEEFVIANAASRSLDRRATALEEQNFDTKTIPPIKVTTPKLNLTDGEVQSFKQLAQSIVSRTLAYECEYRQLGCPEPSSKEWKLLKKQAELSVYKHRAPHSEQQSSKTYNVVCVGSLEGTIEDALYGTHSKNRDDMQATAAFLHRAHMECAVLNVLESGSDEDPFRQVSLKWFISEMFGDARLVNHRDWFNIESVGITTDEYGHRYGYFLAKFADHPGCPPMPEDSDVVRGMMNMCCIYRQEPGSRVVNVYAKGSIDLGGGLPAFITSCASCAMMFNMAVSIESAEGKRLTKLALMHQDKRAKERLVGAELGMERSHQDTTDSMVDLLAASAISCSTASSCDSQTKETKVSREPCHICGRRPAMSKLVRSSHRKCGICKERACGKCNVKRKLFSRSGPVNVMCCKVCIIESKSITIDPRDPCPILK
ncbi:unnamed protein product [Phytophthora fragariaefolia]|uniref:Unnamed protein product n=1 Tax=Phytophthora fragariaefolia TaxID=1490495 RepID=A0A9W6XT53_9STRA|nr:unnamed protein product [Phytophthora fragariaefolia]